MLRTEIYFQYALLLFSRSVVSDSATLWTTASQAPLSMEFSRQEHWSGLPFPSPGHLPHPGIQPVSPILAADSLTLPPGKHFQDATEKYSSEESSVSIFMCSSGGSEWAVVLAATN